MKQSRPNQLEPLMCLVLDRFLLCGLAWVPRGPRAGRVHMTTEQDVRTP